MHKLLNNQLNRLSVDAFKQASKIPIVIVLDNIRSQYNVGSIFRTADAFRVESIFLCGITATPPTPEIHKSALGSENSVDWQYFSSTIQAVDELKINGYKIISVEQVEGSIPAEKFIFESEHKYAFVFGNEVKGVMQEIVDISDFCIEISQFGTKHSLNVSVAAAIIIWESFKQYHEFFL